MSEPKRESDVERIVREHGGKYTHGQWSRASGLKDVNAATTLAKALEAVHLQVRHIFQDKGNDWVVTFR